jgi:hypothetical protein
MDGEVNNLDLAFIFARARISCFSSGLLTGSGLVLLGLLIWIFRSNSWDEKSRFFLLKKFIKKILF